MLWTMLNAICFLIALIAAIGAARDSQSGLDGYALAVCVGLAFGTACSWIMWKAGEKVDVALRPLPEGRQKLYVSLLYVAGMLWIWVVVFLVDLVTLRILRAKG